MEVVKERCCAIDLGKKEAVACFMATPGRGVTKETRKFRTTTEGLVEMKAWLSGLGCTVVAIESTGPYWKPVWNLFEDSFKLLLANPQLIKAIPGKKTGVKDAKWMADLLRHGLLPSSFVPAREQREFRELIRYRRSLIGERAREANRVQKVLRELTSSWGRFVSNVLEKTGKDILSHLAEGEDDPQNLASLARVSLREPQAELSSQGES